MRNEKIEIIREGEQPQGNRRIRALGRKDR